MELSSGVVPVCRLCKGLALHRAMPLARAGVEERIKNEVLSRPENAWKPQHAQQSEAVRGGRPVNRSRENNVIPRTNSIRMTAQPRLPRKNASRPKRKQHSTLPIL